MGNRKTSNLSAKGNSLQKSLQWSKIARMEEEKRQEVKVVSECSSLGEIIVSQARVGAVGAQGSSHVQKTQETEHVKPTG